MAKLWNVGNGVGEQLHVPTIKRRDFDGKIKEFVRIPPVHTGGREEFVEHKPGNLYLSMHEYPFYVIPKDAPFDVPPGVSVKAIQDLCPQLVTQEEYESLQSQDAAPADEPKPEPKAKKQDKLTQ